MSGIPDWRKKWADLYPREKPDTRVFEFIINEGESLRGVDISYEQYLENEELRRRMFDRKVYKLVLGRTLFLVEKAWMETHAEDKQLILQYEAHNRECPLHYWAPHTDVDVDFLNDEEATIKMAVMMNRRGKTVVGVIDMLLDLIPNDPNWRMFTRYGVKPRDWTGGKTCGVSTYTMGHHQKTTYQEIVKWTPRAYLGTYAPSMQARKMRVEPSWNKSNPTLQLSGKCGSKFIFFSYEQSQEAYEGGVMHRKLWDEQGHENLFDAADRGTTTVMGRHVFSLTPHKLAGRPDTGAGSWIHKLARGDVTKGHNVKVYTGSLLDVPDWVYPESTKEKEWTKWVVEPTASHNNKMLQEGKSRLFGEWHVTAGLVYDEIEPDIHFIDPFPIDGHEMSLYRALDHGTKNPTACLWFAVDAEGFIYVYREFYSAGRSVHENVPTIIEMSGNTRRQIDRYIDPNTRDEIDRYEEITDGEDYIKTVLDTRSFNTREGSGRPISALYRFAGLDCRPASGKHSQYRIPIVKELLSIDPERTNPITGKKGSPRMFIFNTLTNFIKEWQGYVWDEYAGNKDDKNPKEKPRDKDNHLMSCLDYGCQIPLRYFGDLPGMSAKRTTISNAGHTDAEEPQCERTGY